MSNSWMSRPLSAVDPEIAQAIANEENRQHEGLELIASENFVSEAVLEAAGSVFTNKYAEGYPAKRYYGGCEFADVVENLARERAKQLFGAEPMPTSSRTRARRPTWPPTPPSSSPATPSWDSTSPTADTSPTDTSSASAANLPRRQLRRHPRNRDPRL